MRFKNKNLGKKKESPSKAMKLVDDCKLDLRKSVHEETSVNGIQSSTLQMTPKDNTEMMYGELVRLPHSSLYLLL
jgi:hypothetical protein